jgi:MoxR-like ATPase
MKEIVETLVETDVAKTKLEEAVEKASKSPIEILDSEGELCYEEELLEKLAEEATTTSGDYVQLNSYFFVPKPLYRIVKRNVEKGVNTLLLGPTGVGKTELVSNIAKEMNLPLTVFDMGTMTDPIMSLIGNHVIHMQDGVTTSSFVKSRFSQVIQQPGIVLLDELSRANLTANNLLFPCLDFRRELPMEYAFDGNAPIKVHPQCVFVATANLGGQYTGAHKLDRALIDRFMCIEIDPLKTSATEMAIHSYCPFLSEDEVRELVRVYDSINNEHANFNISFSLSIRHLKMIADMVKDGFTMYDGFMIVCKGLGGEEGKKAIEPIINTKK